MISFLILLLVISVQSSPSNDAECDKKCIGDGCTSIDRSTDFSLASESCRQCIVKCDRLLKSTKGTVAPQVGGNVPAKDQRIVGVFVDKGAPNWRPLSPIARWFG